MLLCYVWQCAHGHRWRILALRLLIYRMYRADAMKQDFFNKSIPRISNAQGFSRLPSPAFRPLSPYHRICAYTLTV